MKLSKLLVCIGAQKAGTSWLSANLNHDPRFSRCTFPFIKEIHYFDHLYLNSPFLNQWRAHCIVRLLEQNKDKEKLESAFFKWLKHKPVTNNKNEQKLLLRRLRLLFNEADDAWYEELLHIFPHQECALDITPDYAVIGAEGFKHIGRMAEDVKILFIMRKPVDRAWSGLVQGKKHTPEGTQGFLNRTSEETLLEILNTGLDVGARTNYLATLRHLKEAGLFPNQVLIKFYDEISTDPEKFITDIYQFIDMSAPSMDIFANTLRDRIHASPKETMPAEIKEKVKLHYLPMLETINEEFKEFITIPENWFE
jgi:hypothetical protein